MNTDKLQATNHDNVTFTWSQGFRFHFEDDGREIIATGSAFTGKEEIFVNGENVSDKRTVKVSSTHHFTIDEDQYELEFHMVKILTSELDCILIKNGTHLKTLKFQAIKSPWDLLKSLLGGLLIGSVIGAVIGGVAMAIILYFGGVK
ncbi:MAG: hypothetical protein HRU25_16095 [Psychrobium sp.]|nr:hypothetical protein [Psychrobium sp.]